MTDEQILEIIEEIRPNISKLAFIFIYKMKQPSPYSIQDLEQEGEHAVLEQIKRNRPDKIKGEPSTYLIRSVITRFIDLMHRSYKLEPINRSGVVVVDLPVTVNKTVNFQFEELNTLLRVIEILNTREKQYVSIMINPPEGIRNKFSRNRKVVRKLVRETLNMSQKEEREVRKEIKKKLTTNSI